MGVMRNACRVSTTRDWRVPWLSAPRPEPPGCQGVSVHWPVRFRARHWRCVGCCCASIRSNKIVSLDVNESLMERRLGRCRGYCFVSTSLRYTLIAPRTPLPYAPEHLIQHGVPQPPIFLFCERPKSATCHTEISTHAHHTHPNRSR